MIEPVTLAPEAEAQVRAVDAWWRSERPLAPNLFVDELAEALERSRQFAGAEQRVPHRNVPNERRVLAMWNAVRGRDPYLGRL